MLDENDGDGLDQDAVRTRRGEMGNGAGARGACILRPTPPYVRLLPCKKKIEIEFSVFLFKIGNWNLIILILYKTNMNISDVK